MRVLVALSVALAVGLLAVAVAAGLGAPWALVAVAAGLCAALGFWATWRHPAVALDAAASSRGLAWLSGPGTLAALVLLTRLLVFMADPAQVGASLVPSSDWEVRHSCLTAYSVAAQAVERTPRIYDDALYDAPGSSATGVRTPRMLGPFRVDVFEYPPPFLLLPRAVGVLAPDFLRQRLLWFALEAGLMLGALLAVARALGPTVGTRALLMSPLVWVAYPTLSVLQKGNVQGAVIAASMLAMLLFERRRWAAGGAVLAFVTLSKLFPGMLLVYLLARRQWRALAWTAVMGAVWLGLSLLDLGGAPYAAFLERLPQILGGEAFPAFRNPAAMAINFSVPGLAFKLKLFGVPGMGFAAAKALGWVYTLVVIAAAWAAGRRTSTPAERPLAWLTLLLLATLRSPFLPQAYAAFTPLWLLTLLAATAAPHARTLAALGLTWLGLNVFWPLDWTLAPRTLALLSGVPQLLTFALAALALARVLRRGHLESRASRAALAAGARPAATASGL
ncbi:DUF2029 domain-containing protein [Aggregicoccus sp. 17bor-14]|uniref:glycosyltransferase family 87 protein n=1 Tax=Myxococcaceae TaxID=31 RepID=UPI00129C146B|nr:MULTISPECIES: glycosyltransferase family 87 protein [Myxococcaceae]MBF5044952.1 DUF2029 domain-containing protein [Simulacricoccus sp. 17bor-14]MRI90695.1 DUF2029 domain-containing protein [Aggregicoccus sp. 17bor-14]